MPGPMATFFAAGDAKRFTIGAPSRATTPAKPPETMVAREGQYTVLWFRFSRERK
jgi:hypothetical protein